MAQLVLGRYRSTLPTLSDGDYIEVAVDASGRVLLGIGPAYSTVKSGELQGSATALQMPNIACALVKFKAVASNVGNVYIGAAGVTVADGTTDVTSGIELTPGDETGWIPVANLNVFYRICNNAGDDLTYLALV